jgi:hypothetical protein
VSIVLVLALYRGALAWSAPETACWDGLGDAWFTAEVATAPLDLPAGVAMNVLPARSGAQQIYEIRVRNASARPLYTLNRRSNPSFAAPPPIPLPPTLEVGLKTAENTVYAWDVSSRDWRAYSRQDQVTIGSYTADVRFADGRPAAVAVPAPTTQSIRFIFDDQLVTVPTTLTYALNPNYDPHYSASNPDGLPLCSQLPDQRLGLGYLILFIHLFSWALLLLIVVAAGIYFTIQARR